MFVPTLMGLMAVAQFFGKADSTIIDTVWGYDAPGYANGPEVTTPVGTATSPPWPVLCRNGSNQSPINMNTSQVQPATSDITAYPLTLWGYNLTNAVTIINNGHSVTATGFNLWGDGYGSQTPYINHGGLSTKYNLVNFHLHWGADSINGSEHLTDGNTHTMELHLVHQKSTYNTTQANSLWDGMAVLSVLFTLDPSDGSALSQLQTAYNSIDTFNASTPQNVMVRLDQMLPSNTTSFWRYNGSLTTPPCSEIAIWTIFTNTRTTTSAQLVDLRQHVTQEGYKLKMNHRNPMNPVDNLNGRIVLRNQ